MIGFLDAVIPKYRIFFLPNFRFDEKYHQKLPDDFCPSCCKRSLVEVKETGFIFCSDGNGYHGCDYEAENQEILNDDTLRIMR